MANPLTPWWEQAFIGAGQSLGDYLRTTPFMKLTSGEYGDRPVEGLFGDMSQRAVEQTYGYNPISRTFLGLPGVGLGGILSTRILDVPATKLHMPWSREHLQTMYSLKHPELEIPDEPPLEVRIDPMESELRRMLYEARRLDRLQNPHLPMPDPQAIRLLEDQGSYYAWPSDYALHQEVVDTLVDPQIGGQMGLNLPPNWNPYRMEWRIDEPWPPVDIMRGR